MSAHVDLSTFDNSWYKPGRSKIVAALWFFFGHPLIRSSLNPSSAIRRLLLRFFGARIGSGVVIKPGIKIKYPWRLTVGANSWIGEDCWIDNLEQVTIGSNVCLSQGAYLCTGNHDWSDSSFGLIAKSITIEDGAWIGAKSVIAPGVTIEEAAVALIGSVVTARIPAFEIHAGSPARRIRMRKLRIREERTDEELTWS